MSSSVFSEDPQRSEDYVKVTNRDQKPTVAFHLQQEDAKNRSQLSGAIPSGTVCEVLERVTQQGGHIKLRFGSIEVWVLDVHTQPCAAPHGSVPTWVMISHAEDKPDVVFHNDLQAAHNKDLPHGKIPNNTQVMLMAPAAHNGAWAQVKHNDMDVWVRGAHVKSAGANSGPPQVPPAAPPAPPSALPSGGSQFGSQYVPIPEGELAATVDHVAGQDHVQCWTSRENASSNQPADGSVPNKSRAWVLERGLSNTDYAKIHVTTNGQVFIVYVKVVNLIEDTSPGMGMPLSTVASQ